MKNPWRDISRWALLGTAGASLTASAAVSFLGIASGDASLSGATLWTRAVDAASPTEANLKAEVSENATFGAESLTFATKTDGSKDYTAKVQATGLKAGTRYYYRFTDGSVTSDVGTFKTPPAPQTPAPVKFAFSGDADGLIRPYALASQIPAKRLDFFMFNGDTIYETSTSIGSPAVSSTGTIPAPSTNGATAATLKADFLRKYREQFLAVNPGGQAGLKSFFAGQGNYTAMDNHELGNKQYINGGAPAGGLVGDMPTGAGVDARILTNDVNTSTTDFMNRSTGFKTLVDAYMSYQPIQDRGTVKNPTDPRTDGTRQLYFSQQWGRHVVLINADDRTYRDIRLKKASDGSDDTGDRADNPKRTMLGKTQLAWLKRTLLDAQRLGTTWKIVNVSDPIDQIGPIGGTLNLVNSPTAAEYGALGKSNNVVSTADSTNKTIKVAKTIGLVVGQPLSAAGVPAGTLISAINADGTSFAVNNTVAITNGTPIALSPAVSTYAPVNNDGGKSWIGGYRAERNELLKFIADNRIMNVVFLAADDHQNRVNELTYSPNGDTANQATYAKVPACFTIVCGPLGATGPDYISNHSIALATKLANSIAAAQTAAGVEPIGLDGFPGLRDVFREGDATAKAQPQPVDFYSPDTFNYNMLEVSEDGRNLTVTGLGINSTTQNSFLEYDAANNPERVIFRFNVEATNPETPNPAAFTFLNINNPIPSTINTNADGSFTVIAGGGDTYDSADSFNYFHEARTGDFDVQVQVLSVTADAATAGQKNAKASLQVRANLSPGSPNIQVSVSPVDGANYIETIFRPTQDGATDDPPSGSPKFDAGPYEGTYRPSTGDVTPAWIRARRERNLIQTLYSTDGINWNILAEYQMDNFPGTAFVGLSTVAHVEASGDQALRVRATYSNYRNTPKQPLAQVNGAPAEANSPGTFPDATVTGVNWHLSLPSDGIGYTADKTQSGPIVWNTGGFGTISRDLMVSIDDEQGPLEFGIARYATGALDFGIGVKDPVAAQQNLGPYSNPQRQRIGTPEASVPAAQAWFPSPRHGVLVPVVRKVGPVSWNDGAAPFYPHVFMAVDGSSTRAFNMDNGNFAGGDFYLRMAKIADMSEHPNSAANSAGGFQRAAFDCSVAWFPFHQGWKAGYFADASGGTKGRWNRPYSHSAAASDGTFAVDRSTAAALLRWEDLGGETYGGLGTLSLPKVNSLKDGLLFLTGNDDNTARGPQVNCAPLADGTGWTVAVRSVEENKNDPATYADADKSEFSFLYVPLNTANLIGGEIDGAKGTASRSAGAFTVSRVSSGRYLIKIAGKSSKSGMIILQAVGNHPANKAVVDNVTLSYEANADGFLVESRAVNPAAPASASAVQLRDANFQFAWVDFTNPLSPAVVVPQLAVERSGSNLLISWKGAGSSFVLEATPSLVKPSWAPLTDGSATSFVVPNTAATQFFRLRAF